MDLIVTKDLGALLTFREKVRVFSDRRWETEAHRGVMEAGRKVLTIVRKTARDQMGIAPGYYSSFVVKNTRGFGQKQNMSYTIAGSRKGGDIKAYRGLRALKPTSRIAKKSHSLDDRGLVRSSVWNVSRVFKRSFKNESGYFALIPKSGIGKVRTPKEFWTIGNKDQPRNADGTFKAMRTGFPFRVRRLYGPSLSKEISDTNTVKRAPNQIHIVFERDAPRLMEQYVMKRMGRLLK